MAQKTREARNAYAREWRDKNREKLKQYRRDNAHKYKEYQDKYNLVNKDRIRAREAQYKRDLLDYKAALGCSHCGVKIPEVLQFHHRDPAEKKFSIGLRNTKLEHLMDEINKCDLVCANCHLIEHARLRKEADICPMQSPT